MEYVLTARNNLKNTPFVFVMFKGQNIWKELREWLNTNINISLSVAWPTVAQLEIFFSSDYLWVMGSFLCFIMVR